MRQSYGVTQDPANGQTSVGTELDILVRLARGSVERDPDKIVRRALGPHAPLSFAQERLWFLDRMEQGSAYISYLPLQLSGVLDVESMERTLGEVVRRHEVLRTVFAEVDGAPVQVITPFAGFRLPVEEMQAVEEEELRREIREELVRPFDLQAGPLLRARLLRVSEQQHVLVISMHHIVTDGWSIGVLQREMSVLYEAYRRGEPSPLPELAVQYADYASWQREQLQGELLHQGLAYWKGQLAGAPTLLDLPADHPRPAVQSYRGSREMIEIPIELLERLQALGRREGVTLFMVLLGAWQVLLSKYSGSEDVVVGSPISGRNRREIGDLIGFFVNMLVLRTDLSGDPSFRQVLGRVREVALSGYEHQEVPFEKLVAELQPERSLSHSPLFQVGFQLQEAGDSTPGLSGLQMQSVVGVEPATTKTDVALIVGDLSHRFVAVLIYSTDLFERETIQRMLCHLERVLEQVSANADVRISELELMGSEERLRLLYEWNDTAVEYPRDQCIHELFAEQVSKRPDAVALVWGREVLSYQELNRRSNQLAHYLVGLGVGPESRVGVMLERGVDLIVSLLAILKAGGAYVPLDPSYPEERLKYMLGDAEVGILLSRADLSARLTVEDVHSIWLDEVAELLEAASGEETGNRAVAENIAYIVYTSGSTGRPKGVIASHRGVVQLVVGTDYVQLGPGDRIAQASNASFDALTFELWGALLNGATLIGIDKEALLSPTAMGRVLEGQGVTTLYQTTALLNELSSERPELLANLREVLFGGQAVDAESVRRILRYGKPLRLLHMYGPTETTAWCTYETVNQVVEEARTVSVGRPTANQRMYILDSHLQPTVLGVGGEGYAAGAGLARGYLNRPGLTAERFVPDPFAMEAGERMYRTGDRMRWGAEGSLEFLGRFDEQVKIRGFRIEPGEVESVLGSAAGVREVRVMVREDAPGEKRLVAYVVGDAEAEQLRLHVKRSLPDYMVPAAFVSLERLPLTPNGKLDRKALPVPEVGGGEAGYIAPRTPVEEVLAKIWAEVLRVERVGVNDNFFALGGHSLLAIRIISRIRQVFGIEMPVRAMYDQAVLGQSAEVVEGLRRTDMVALPPVTRVERQGAPQLSFAQERLWFLDRMEQGRAYISYLSLRLSGELDAESMERALGEVVRRHEVLRTVFAEVDGAPVQVITPFAGFRLPVEEMQAVEEEELRREIREELVRPFDLQAGPVLRARLLRVSEQEYVLVISMHHIVTDGWSLGVLQREMSVLYEAYRKGEPSPLPELAVQYADYASWQREQLQGEFLHQGLAYWKGQLAGAPALLDLPADHPRAAVQSYRGAQEVMKLRPELLERLQALGRREGVTLFMVLLGAWQVLLSKYSGSEDVVVGSPIAGRNRREIEDLIGFFVNMLVLRTDLSGDPSFRQVLGRVREVALSGYEHQEVPFEKLVAELQPERSLSHSPLFQVAFQLQEAGDSTPGLSRLQMHSVSGVEPATAKFDLQLDFGASSDGFAAVLVYSTDLFEQETIQRMLCHLERVLEQVSANADVRISELELMGSEERLRLLYEWNDTAVEYPRGQCIHELFEEQVSKTPDAVAAVYEGESLSYGELNRQANQLGHYLRELGVKPDARVGICLERSLAMMVALLGVLKAGGAYVPLDPNYPPERLSFMLEDSAPTVLLTQGSLQGLLQGMKAELPLLDVDAPLWETQPESNPERNRVGLKPSHLAYVIYTSGSTGTPKGVMVEHRNTVNFIDWARQAFAEYLECTLFSTSLNFDLAVYECLVPITVGGRVQIVRSLLELTQAARDISLINTVPSALQALMEASGIPETVRGVNLAGEQLKSALVDRVFSQSQVQRVCNLYGPSEATTYSTWMAMGRGEVSVSHIGRPIANTSTYLLDAGGGPVPERVCGELYVGGAGMARGYLNRPGLTAERFVPDPFAVEPGARMYRTGDLGRYRADGNIEFLGRNDFQVKVRGFRIELGEIEARLSEQSGVREAVVIAREDVAGEKRLVAYVVGEADAGQLRMHLQQSLPEYMVPAAFVILERLPLTPNGKLDRKALPAPDEDAYARRGDEAPVGEIERALAVIWAEVLKLEQIGRYDNFFELGGHSLLAVTMIERMRREGFKIDVRTLFATPTIAELAASVIPQERVVEVPANQIPEGCEVLTPEMLPLVRLTGEEIERIVAGVAGGAGNVQDIYPLAPLQQGLLFHHLLRGEEGDPYVLAGELSFDTRAQLDRYLEALQAVIDRHDILRTAVVWEGISEPVQVVWRKARLKVEEVELSGTDGDAAAELYERFNPRRYRIDIRQAPMLRHFVVYEGEKQRWVMMELMHHLVGDHTTLAGIQEEIQAHLLGQAEQLPAPLPFRNLVAQALLGTSREEHEVFFQQMLGDVSEPTAPFGLLNVQRDGAEIGESRVEVDALVARRVRERARKLGVSAASIFHLAWALVLSKLSGQQDVVFGTVLFGRMQGGAGSDRAMGLFINTLPVRIHIGEEGAEASVRRMHMLLADLLRHEHASLALAQRCSGVRAPLPLFSALFNYRHGARRTQAPSEEKKKVWAGVQWLYGEERTNYPCVLSVDDFGDDFKLTAQVDTSIKAERVCDYMSTSLVSVVAALEGAPSSMVSTLAILPLQERHRMLQEWNQTDEVLSCQCIHELFEEQVSQTPDGVAVVYEGESLSYGELNRRANQLGHYLRELGVKPDARVGICLERSLAMVVALLGVLKAGGAYVPLDPNHPPERLSFMLEDSAPTVLLTQGSLQGLLPGVRADLPLLDVDAPLWERQPETNPERESVGLKPNHLAYVIYTSGSTGTPKGVMVEHRNVSRLFAATDKWFQFSGKDVWTLFHSYAFDFSVWEIWGALLYGGRLIVVAQELSRSPEDFYRLVCAEGVTVLNQTPSAFRSMMVAQGKSDKVHCLRLVIFGGEALEVGMLKPWYEHNGAAQTQLVNMYGITETTVHVSYRPLERGDTERQGDSPIGQRICDLRTYILDGQTEPVPERVCGELYVGGAGMARGYLNRPGLTAERFVPDPFAVEPGARMYRTGDLGRYRADGNIEFLGRNDFQVKVRGFRIELGEIEARLSEQSGVREAVVIAREDVAGEKRLVAYVVGEADAGQLRMHLQQSLPGYMVPAAFVILERLPLTPNGKLDRKALPAPDEDAYARRGDEAPVGEIERALAVIWAEVLKLEQIGRYDNFFELGGHSLLAVTMIERMRREGFKIDVRTLFATPTIAELAASVIPQERVVEVPANKIPEGCEVLTPEMLPLVRLTGEEIERIVAGVAGGAGNVQDIYPLAPLQQGLLFHHLLRGEEGDPYVLAGELSFDTRAQLDRYLEALQAVIDRHDILRTAVVWEGISEPVQVVWRKARLKVEEVELSGTDGDAAAELYERFNPRRYRIDIRQAPMLRHFVVYEGEKQRWVMMELMHHLVGDHTTLAGIQEEIQAHLLGQAEQLPAPLPFRNLVAQALLGTSREEHEVFFQQMLGDVSEPTAPFGLLNVQRDGAEIGESRVEVDALVARRVRERARKLGVSAASIFHLAWALVLSKLSGQQDVVFGTVLFGRMQGGAGSDRAMGLFINTLPVRIHIGEEGAEASVRRMHMLLADLLRHEHASLALAQRCSGVRAPLPLFSALFNYRHGARRTQAPSEEKKKVWAGVQWLYGEERTNYPCVLSVDDFGDDFKLTAQVDTSIKAERVCDYMSTSLVSVVAALEGAPSSMVSTLAILSLQERHRMLQEWNQTDEVLSCQCIHELFEEQVSQTPDGVAVVYEGESLSYGELNRRANQLGHYLRELGVKPDARVGICLERSLAMVVALLGVLKAGGAYVPLDPNHPPERLSFMLEDSAPTVLLTQGSLQGLLPGVRADLPLLDVDAPLWERQPETNPERESVGLKPNHLAYVIYTSGSTGTPKGVMVEHRNVSRLFAATDKWFQFSGKDVWTLFHSYAFDFSVWEIWGALLYGGRLIVVAQELSRSPEDFYRLVCAEGVTVLNQTPSAFRSMMVAQGKSDKVHCLRLVIFGGEALEVGMLKPWYEHNGAAQTQLVNMYGITETTVHVSYRPLERGDTERQGDSPIGQRICDLRTYILDGQTEPVPERVCGELYVGGAGMARGYLNRPGLTAERFVPDPFAVEPGARMYRTGDLGRYRADGNIEFLGRNDFQVKVRGFRIELGEIEARLSEQSGVREAVVIAREDVAGEKRLVAYVVGEADAGQLRMHLQQSLPEYMVPAAFVILERLPLTPNGKLDRKALPMPDVHASIGAVSPRNEVEKQVAEIWKKTLGISSLGIEDNFFDLGGNSILLYRVFGLLRSLRNDLQLVDLFRYPTVSAIAAYLAAEATPSSPPHLVAARARARHRANKRHIA